MDESRLPVIIGVAQYTNRSEDLSDACEPLDMMALVARRAEEDAGVPGLLTRVDSLRVVNILAWRYEDPARQLAGRLGLPVLRRRRIRPHGPATGGSGRLWRRQAGLQPREALYTTIGGNTPQWLANETADAIAAGRVGLALVAGAEAIHSVRLARQQGVTLPWTPRSSATPPMVGDSRIGLREEEIRHGARMPIQVYPLFENALRAARGRGLEEHRQHLGRLCERLARVAADNPYAWFRDGKSAQEIATVCEDNRMVGYPYTKYMNAIIEVDQAAAYLMTSAALARELGVAPERWVYLWGGADANDIWWFTERIDFHSSPALRWAGQRALARAGLGVEEIDLFDLYSCFPSAVEVACDMLGIPEDDWRPLTVTGGLPYFGGAGNNYCSHAIAAMVERLRREPEKKGLISAMGWFVTKHSVGVYSARPPSHEWAPREDAREQEALNSALHPELAPEAAGEGTVEAYTVMHGRDGEPEQGIVVGRLVDGRRFIANTEADSALLRSMTEREMVGEKGRLSHDSATGLNMISF
jgi:acetyl-CoA C-acetyltransferase